MHKTYGWYIHQSQIMRSLKKPGVIINIGSAAGLYPMYADPIYSGTKGSYTTPVYFSSRPADCIADGLWFFIWWTIICLLIVLHRQDTCTHKLYTSSHFSYNVLPATVSNFKFLTFYSFIMFYDTFEAFAHCVISKFIFGRWCCYVYKITCSIETSWCSCQCALSRGIKRIAWVESLIFITSCLPHLL
jgi:hypothetical protein